MGGQTDSIGFHGVLGRASFEGTSAVLRFCPFHVQTDPHAAPVFVARFDDVRFDESALAPFFDQEVEVDVFNDRVVVTDIFEGVQAVLHAGSVASQREAYDLEELLARITRLEAECEWTNSALNKAHMKDREGLELVRELTRRAETKAAFSDHLKERQAAAISVLTRLLRHFERG